VRALPSLNALRAFEAAGKLGSISAAAQELRVTPGAVSRHVGLLEAHFRCRLFARERYGMRLTDKGKLLYDAVHRAFAGIDEASRALFEAPSTILTVHCYTTLATEWLVPRLHAFRSAHPEVDLHLKVSLRPPSLARGEADLGIVARRTLTSDLGADPLFPAWYAPVCAPCLGLEEDRPAWSVAAHPLIHAPREERMWRAWASLAGIELDLGGGLGLETLSLTYQAARGGAGIALGQLFIVMDDLARGNLIMPVPLVLDDQFMHWLIYPAARRDEPAIASFRSWVLAEAAATNRKVGDYLAARGIVPGPPHQNGARSGPP
jgi:LysR family glycine cleavage system transcriptional activator